MQDSSRKELARILVDLDAIKVAGSQPFFYTSGWASPIYLDAQGLLSDVAARKRIMRQASEIMAPVIEQQGIRAIVGTESSGVAYAAWMAQTFELPLLFLRKKPVGWGMHAQIEGHFQAGDPVILVDDLTTDGKSKIDASLALRKSGLSMHHAFVLIDFGIYPYTAELLRSHALTIHALLDWATLFEALRDKGDLPAERLKTLEDFTRDPVAWSLHHGGIGQWTN
ncbi:orotate phosphoribosyltransferase [Orrella sp. 11846]|uniref:orotate phosphoribosyltransferase n=1 Tax=Orrella sp. 11846 TaxID=3409913 RepID=UPI003B5CCD60